MAKPDWGALQQRFLSDHARTNISPSEWCESQGLNYATARRYIKKPAAQSAQKTAQKKMRNCAVSTGTDNPGRSPKDKPELPVKPTVNEPNNFSSIPDELGLSERHRVFAEYIAEGKALVEAYRLAGYQGEGATAHSNASRMLRNARVSCAVRFLRDQRQRRLSLTENEIIHQLSSIASADPNQLVQYRRLNCRYCWGERHLYFWRDIEEFDKAAEKASEDGKHEPEYGGIGFVGTAYPNPECPKCNGEGEAQLFVADTTQLDGPARWLYAGIKQTQHGTEMRMANQEAARRDLLKLLEAKKSGTGSGIAKRGVTDYSPNDYRNAQTQLGDGLKDLD